MLLLILSLLPMSMCVLSFPLGGSLSRDFARVGVPEENTPPGENIVFFFRARARDKYFSPKGKVLAE